MTRGMMSCKSLDGVMVIRVRFRCYVFHACVVSSFNKHRELEHETIR